MVWELAHHATGAVVAGAVVATTPPVVCEMAQPPPDLLLVYSVAENSAETQQRRSNFVERVLACGLLARVDELGRARHLRLQLSF